jgi:hypothetical protein
MKLHRDTNKQPSPIDTTSRDTEQTITSRITAKEAQSIAE